MERFYPEAEMIVQLSKALLALLTGLWLLLVGVHNIVDYGVNFEAVRHVMSMDTVPAGTVLKWHAVTSPTLQHLAYLAIIAIELTSGVLCVWGAGRLWQARGEGAEVFNASKDVAIAGLVCGVALYLFVFLAIGGEWFQMWRSPTWNVQQGAFRFLASIGLILVFLNQRDGELA